MITYLKILSQFGKLWQKDLIISHLNPTVDIYQDSSFCVFWYFSISINPRNNNLKKSQSMETWMMDQSQGGIKFDIT